MLAGAQRHVTVDRALRLLGMGTGCVVPVESDDQGRMLAGPLRDALAAGGGPTIVCAQAGNVNTGSFDPLDEIADAVEGTGAWLHVDGAFGLWAAASPRLAHLVAGSERADSWATDAHKWLNVPYDSGHRVLRAPRLAPRGDGDPRRLPDPGRRGQAARPDGLGARVLAPRPRLRRLRGAALARPQRRDATSSSAAATTRGCSPSCSARATASRSSTTSC